MSRRVALAAVACLAAASLAAAAAPASGTTTLLVPRAAGTLDFVDPGSGLLLASVALDIAPRRVTVSPDGRLAAVLGCRTPASGVATVTVSVVGLEYPQELRRIELGRRPCPTSLTWPATNRVTLTPGFPGASTVIDTDSGEVQSVSVAAQPASGAGALRHTAAVDASTAAVQRVLAEGGRIEDLAVSTLTPRAVCHACTTGP